MIDTYKEDGLYLSFDIINNGELAKNILIKSTSSFGFVRKHINSLSNSKKFSILIYFDAQVCENIENRRCSINEKLTLTYNNIYGRAYEHIIIYKINAYPDANDLVMRFSVDIYMKDTNN